MVYIIQVCIKIERLMSRSSTAGFENKSTGRAGRRVIIGRGEEERVGLAQEINTDGGTSLNEKSRKGMASSSNGMLSSAPVHESTLTCPGSPALPCRVMSGQSLNQRHVTHHRTLLRKTWSQFRDLVYQCCGQGPSTPKGGKSRARANRAAPASHGPKTALHHHHSSRPSPETQLP